MTPRVRNLLILVAVATAVVLFVFVKPGGEEEPSAPTGDTQSLEDAQGEGEDVEEGDGDEADGYEVVDLPEADSDAVLTTAEEFAQAWQSWSFEDERPTEWAKRAKEFATDRYGAELDGIYASDDGDNLEWKARKQRQYVQSTTVEQLTPYQYDAESKTASVDVHMTTERESNDGVFDGTNEQTAEIVLVKDGDRWLVDSAMVYVAHGEPSDDELGGDHVH